jgi:alkyl hydroperoxide reductase subunit D
MRERKRTMSLKQFADTLPDYAKDLRLNVGSLLSDQTLGDQRKYGLLLACAHGTGYRPIVAAAEAEVEGKLARGGQRGARRRGGDGDEQRLLPLRPPRFEPRV